MSEFTPFIPPPLPPRKKFIQAHLDIILLLLIFVGLAWCSTPNRPQFNPAGGPAAVTLSNAEQTDTITITCAQCKRSYTVHAK